MARLRFLVWLELGRWLPRLIPLVASLVLAQTAGQAMPPGGSTCGPGMSCRVSKLTTTATANQLCLRGPVGGNDLLLSNIVGGHLWQNCTQGTNCTAGCSTYFQNLPTASQWAPAIALADGSALSPALRFTSDATTGFYRSGAGIVSYGSVGTASLDFYGTGVIRGSGGANSQLQLLNASGSTLTFGASSVQVVNTDVYLNATANSFIKGTISNPNASTPLTVSDAEGLRVVGITGAGGFATCAAALSGTVQYDNGTNMEPYLCSQPNGLSYAWRPLHWGAGIRFRSDTIASGVITVGNNLLGATTLQNFAGTLPAPATAQCQCMVETAGTGAGNYTLSMYDTTAATVRGGVSVACAAAALTPTSAPITLASVVPANPHVLRVTASACTTLPTGLHCQCAVY